MPNSGRSRRRRRAAAALPLVPAVAGHVGVQVVRGRGEAVEEVAVVRPARRAARSARCPADAWGRHAAAASVRGRRSGTGHGSRRARTSADCGPDRSAAGGFGEHGSDGESTDSLHKPPRRVRERRGVRPGIAADSTGADTVSGEAGRHGYLACPVQTIHRTVDMADSGPMCGLVVLHPARRAPRPGPRPHRAPPPRDPVRTARPGPGGGQDKKPAVSAARPARTRVTSGVRAPRASSVPPFPPVTGRRPRVSRGGRRTPAGVGVGGREAAGHRAVPASHRRRAPRSAPAPACARAPYTLRRARRRWERTQHGCAPDPEGVQGPGRSCVSTYA